MHGIRKKLRLAKYCGTKIGVRYATWQRYRSGRASFSAGLPSYARVDVPGVPIIYLTFSPPAPNRRPDRLAS